MLWSNERIAEEINDIWNRDGELYGPNVEPIMQKMRDEYEKSIADLRATIYKQADTVAEATCLLEQAHDRINLLESARNDSIEYNATLVNTLALRDRHVAELEAQLAAVLRTIEAATRASQ